MFKPGATSALVLLTVFQAAALRMVKKPQAGGDGAGADMSERNTSEQSHQTACDWEDAGDPEELEYGNATCAEDSGNCNQLYDLYKTSAATDAAVPVPLGVFVHGGSWKFGDKQEVKVSPEFLALRQRGMHIASINYRLSPDVVHPTHVNDVKAAIAHFKSDYFVETYNIDPTRIFLFGSSAGGHLASFVGITEQIPVVNFYGVVGLYKDWDSITGMLNCTTPADGETACHDLAKNASPATYVSSASPPLLTFCGTKDLNLDGNVALEEIGTNASADFELVTVECRSASKCHQPRTMLSGQTNGTCNADYMYEWLYKRLNWHPIGCAASVC